MVRAFVGMGSNVDPAENVRKALRLLSQEMSVNAVSTVYETEPEGRQEQARYYNCVVEIEAVAEPADLKRTLRKIEEQLGRVRTADKYAPRVIDLDLLVYDEISMESPGLRLPDPDIATRPYLAAGLAELAPSLALPGIRTTPLELSKRLPAKGMRALRKYSEALRREVIDES